jgi:2-amino-4-hydroxy-6-hydroxymethyldihydropteridine diphosphokinase
MNSKEAKTAYIGMGSNLGDRLQHLKDAAALLSAADGIQLKELSPVYETAPVGYTDQPDFLNCVAKLSTVLTPRELLEQCFEIENSLHRKRTVRWGPRTVDLDLLFYGEAVQDDPDLTLPHPRIQERAFVLIPLMDLAPDLIHPVFRRTIRALLQEFQEQHPGEPGVRPYREA